MNFALLSLMFINLFNFTHEFMFFIIYQSFYFMLLFV
uniref:Uncharacterized protein n=1 Tax=Vertebrata isogona TaxID=2006944 RepID=A0A1Z1MFZ2_9FLOR|nr:hypothetical protein [Vertebrata isogona]ARW64664.1 hypothetical protein [Vertebrata isogona]